MRLFKVLANFSVLLFSHLTTKYLRGKLKLNKTGIYLKSYTFVEKYWDKVPYISNTFLLVIFSEMFTVRLLCNDGTLCAYLRAQGMALLFCLHLFIVYIHILVVIDVITCKNKNLCLSNEELIRSKNL
jgi:hypothetical protein